MQMSDQQIHQIVVVGAGLTGVVTALALSHCGYGSKSAPAVTLIDPANQRGANAKHDANDQRTTTIHAAGIAMLDVLGVWSLIAKAATPVSRIRVAYGQSNTSEPHRSQRPEFSLKWDAGETPMAYVVNNQDLIDALYEALLTRPIIQITGHEVTGFDVISDYARLQFDHRADLLCELIVACDGANSKMRDFASIRTFREPHRQTAIVANLRSEHAHENTAFQRFLPGGPIALMPYGLNRVSLVWSLPKDEAERVLALEDDEFSSLVLTSFGQTLGRLKLDGPRLLAVKTYLCT